MAKKPVKKAKKKKPMWDVRIKMSWKDARGLYDNLSTTYWSEKTTPKVIELIEVIKKAMAMKW